MGAHKTSAHPTEKQLVRCDVCGYLCKTHCLARHREKHQPHRERTWICHICGKGYFDRSQMRDHIRIVHTEVRISCPHDNCGSIFSRHSSLRRHLEVKHDSAGPRFPCPKCDKVFKVKTYLSQHLLSKVHGGPGDFRARQRHAKKLQAQAQEKDSSV